MKDLTNNVIKNFIDCDGILKYYPAKQSKVRVILEYLSSFIDDRNYSEAEINDLIRSKILFEDYVTVRRDLIDFGFLSRTKDGKIYHLLATSTGCKT